MPPAIRPTLKTLARINRALRLRGITPHLRLAAVDRGHYDAGIDAECCRDLGLRPADVRHLMTDFTAAERDRMRASGTRALWMGAPQFVLRDGLYRAAADPF